MWIKTMCGDLLNLNVSSGLYALYGQVIFLRYSSDSNIIIAEYDNEDEAKALIDMIFNALKKGKTTFDVSVSDKADAIIKRKDTVTPDMIEEAVDLWNGLAECGIKPITRMSADSNRYEELKARIRQYGMEGYEKCIENIKKAEILKMNAQKWFNFDWFVKKNNFPKVHDGNYNDNDKKLEQDDFWKN